jgi:hypothetical protein
MAGEISAPPGFSTDHAIRRSTCTVRRSPRPAFAAGWPKASDDAYHAITQLLRGVRPRLLLTELRRECTVALGTQLCIRQSDHYEHREDDGSAALTVDAKCKPTARFRVPRFHRDRLPWLPRRGGAAMAGGALRRGVRVLGAAAPSSVTLVSAAQSFIIGFRAGSRRTPPFHARGSSAHPGSAGWHAPHPPRPAGRTPGRSPRHASSGLPPPSPGP